MAGYAFPSGGASMGGVSRILADQPFVVGLNLFLLSLGWVVPVVALLGLEVLLIGTSLLLPTVAIGAGVVLLLVIYLVASARRGPILAVGPEGVWVSRREGRSGRVVGQHFAAVFLPWSSIERIYLRRVLLDKRVCVQASGRARTARIDIVDLVQSFYGTPFHASLPFADRPADDVTAAITQHGRGKTHIDF
jgi:hypothetical protein